MLQRLTMADQILGRVSSSHVRNLYVLMVADEMARKDRATREPADYAEAIGRRLREEREKRNLSQEWVAIQLFGETGQANQIWRIEIGSYKKRTRRAKLHAYCDLVGISHLERELLRRKYEILASGTQPDVPDVPEEAYAMLQRGEIALAIGLFGGELSRRQDGEDEMGFANRVLGYALDAYHAAEHHGTGWIELRSFMQIGTSAAMGCGGAEQIALALNIFANTLLQSLPDELEAQKGPLARIVESYRDSLDLLKGLEGTPLYQNRQLNMAQALSMFWQATKDGSTISQSPEENAALAEAEALLLDLMRAVRFEKTPGIWVSTRMHYADHLTRRRQVRLGDMASDDFDKRHQRSVERHSLALQICEEVFARERNLTPSERIALHYQRAQILLLPAGPLAGVPITRKCKAMADLKEVVRLAAELGERRFHAAACSYLPQLSAEIDAEKGDPND